MGRGRKARVFGVPSSRRRVFLLTPEEDQQLERVAQDIGVPVATLVRDAVNGYVAECTEQGAPFSCASNSVHPLR